MQVLKTVAVLVGLMSLMGCVRDQPEIIIVTATNISEPQTVFVPTTQAVLTQSSPDIVVIPTLNPTSAVAPVSLPESHIVRAGDTLFLIAQQYGVSLGALVQENNLANPDLLEVGQVLSLPSSPSIVTPSFEILPDSRLVRAPKSIEFDIAGFIAQQNGFIRDASDVVTTRISNGAGFDESLSAAQVVESVSLEYSVDPRLLLAVLEYRSGWLSNPNPREDLKETPVVNVAGIDRKGLYRQLAYVANEVNRGYYAWKGRGLRQLELVDGTRLSINDALNPATIALQYFFSLSSATTLNVWLNETSENGFYKTYLSLFGDPFIGAIEPLVPVNLVQPQFTLPFAQNELWYYTGGPHGGWGSGSAWASLDFAPPDERPVNSSFCYTSQTPVRAVAPGVIARSEDGAVVLDLDLDADESTGWTVLYLHLEANIAVGTLVMTGDPVGFASCAGGFSMATHLHIGRRFNGEWLPTDCASCRAEYITPTFEMSGWRTEGIAGQEYQGYMIRENTRQQAEQGRQTTINHISW